MSNLSPIDEKVFSKLGRRSVVRTDRVCAFLRTTHPVKTADTTAAATGIGAGTIRKWLEGKSSPSGAGMAVLILVYGPEFIEAITDNPPAWVDRTARAERRARVTAMRDRLNDLLEEDA